MARIELRKMLPFTSWDAEKRYGRTTEDYFFTLEYETAKTKAGLTLFVVVWHINNEDSFSFYHMTVDDALEDMNRRVRDCARACGWTPEGELGFVNVRIAIEQLTTVCRMFGECKIVAAGSLYFTVECNDAMKRNLTTNNISWTLD